MQRITIKLTPKAKQNAIRGFRNGVLLVSVTQAPEKGKANKALIDLLSKQWHIPKSSIIMVQGDTTREKVMDITASLSDDVRAMLHL